MDGDISKASLTPIDVRCRQPGCACEWSVPGMIAKEGDADAPEAGTHCPACQHAWSDHERLEITQGPVETGESIPGSIVDRSCPRQGTGHFSGGVWIAAAIV
jgi:hypothetical protein